MATRIPTSAVKASPEAASRAAMVALMAYVIDDTRPAPVLGHTDDVVSRLITSGVGVVGCAVALDVPVATVLHSLVKLAAAGGPR